MGLLLRLSQSHQPACMAPPVLTTALAEHAVCKPEHVSSTETGTASAEEVAYVSSDSDHTVWDATHSASSVLTRAAAPVHTSRKLCAGWIFQELR